MEKVSKIPGIGSPKMQKEVQTLKFVNEKLGDLYELFAHFTRNEWIYESKKIYELEARMTPEEREIFYVDPKTFDWAQATCLYGKGIEYFMNKQDIYEVDDRTGFLLNKNKFRNFDTLRRAFLENKIIAQDPVQIRKEAFASTFVQNQIEKELAKPPTDTTKTQAQRKAELIEQVYKHIDNLQGQVSPLHIKTSMYFFLRFWDRTFSQIIINREHLLKIKEIID